VIFSIQNKLLMLGLVAGLVPTFIIGLIAWTFANKMADRAAQNYRGVAVEIAEKIDRNLFERYGDVQAFGLNQIVHEREHWYQSGEANPIVDVMNRYIDTYDIYYLTMLVDLNGKLIAVNTSDDHRNRVETDWLYDTDFSQSQWFRDAKTGVFYDSQGGQFSGAVVEHMHIDTNVQRIYGDDGLSLGFAAPVYDKTGQVIAIWKNVAKFSLVEEIIQTSYTGLQEQGLGSAELTLLDEKGNIIVDYDPSKVGTLEPIHNMDIIGKFNLVDKNVESAVAVLAGNTGALTHSYHPGKKIYQTAGYSPFKGALGFPGMKWNVLVRVDTAEALACTNLLKSLIVGIMALMVIVISVGSILVAKRFTNVIRSTNRALAAMAKGDLTQRLRIQSRDEFSEMADSFNKFAEAVGAMVESLTENATHLESSSSDLSSLSHDLASGATQATNQSSSVAAAAEEMSVNMRQIAESTDDVSKNVRDAASSVSEMNGSIGEVAEHADHAATAAGNAALLVDLSNEKLAELSFAADQIGKVISVIQEIAEQTNLLALNATIEAARAGSAGHGFAVVASEVKELAKQTATATGDIRKRIQSIQITSGDAVAAIREISTVVNEVHALSGTIAQAVTEQREMAGRIAENVRQTAHAAEAVAVGISESAKASSEITLNINRVDQVLQTTAAGAAQSKSAGESFGRLSGEMRTLVAQFKIDKIDESDNAAIAV
jgi:methyl-accepting chemotaxis protein